MQFFAKKINESRKKNMFVSMINFRRYAIFVQCFSRSFSLNETMTIDTKILVVDLERNGSPEVKINHFK